jgi:alpha-galactosidase/6-phospho-beta-glucosidase family protein
VRLYERLASCSVLNGEVRLYDIDIETARLNEKLAGREDFVTNINMENRGQTTNLPLHAAVETNACFSHDRM